MTKTTQMSFFEEQLPDMDRYLESHASAEPDILKRLRKETYQKTTQPHMISGYLQGRLLSLISKILAPSSILEIGTFTGYSTLCLAEGLASAGKITTLDKNEDTALIAEKYFHESEYRNHIEFKKTNAMNYLQNIETKFDLVFIDADKENYLNYFQLLKPLTHSGSVLLFDNVLWYGKVLEEKPKLESTRAIQELNAAVSKDSHFDNVILPLRDGINLLRRK